MSRPGGRGSAATALTLVALALAVPALPPNHHVAFAGVHAAQWASNLPAVVESFPLKLGDKVSPLAICAKAVSNCPVGAHSARITLTARTSATSFAPPSNNSSVQVAFLLEASPLDGGLETVRGTAGYEISDALYRMVRNSSTIVNSIAAAHPGVNITFALARFLGPCSSTGAGPDDCDSPDENFHVDIANFLSASVWPSAVNATLGNATNNGTSIYDSDLSDAMLVSGSVVAAYGALNTSGFSWSASGHRVVVVIGSTAPQDPAYPIDYCHFGGTFTATNCTISTCSVLYNFTASQSSPPCERWAVGSGPSSPNASIAGIAGNSTVCSVLGCTVDVIDLWTSSTDPNSSVWTNRSIAVNDTARVARSGCDIASATGGSWDGPAFDSCRGKNGTLSFAGYNSAHSGFVSAQDPTLFSALSNLSLGYAPTPVSSAGQAIFRWALPSNFQLAPSPNFAALCSRAGNAPSQDCQVTPSVFIVRNETLLTWNWSTVPSRNELNPGDTWTASFDVVAATGIAGSYSVSDCGTLGCGASRFGVVAPGLFSGAYYKLASLGQTATQTFPKLSLQLQSHRPLEVSASASTTQGPAPLQVLLSASTVGGAGPSTVHWTISGVGTFNGATVSVTLDNPGRYEAKATANDSFGDSASASVEISVWSSASVLTVGLDLPGAFTVDTLQSIRSTVAGGEPPYSYSWDVPSGCTAGLDGMATCLVDSAGSYPVSLTVRDTGNRTGGASGTLLVNPALRIDSAVGSASCPAASGQRSVTYQVAVSGGTPPYSYAWTVGNSPTLGTGSAFVATYSGAPPVTVVHVTDASGSAQAATTYVAYPVCAPQLGSRSATSAYGLPMPWVAGLVLAVGGSAVVLLLAFRGRRQRGRID